MGVAAEIYGNGSSDKNGLEADGQIVVDCYVRQSKMRGKIACAGYD